MSPHPVDNRTPAERPSRFQRVRRTRPRAPLVASVGGLAGLMATLLVLAVTGHGSILSPSGEDPADVPRLVATTGPLDSERLAARSESRLPIASVQLGPLRLGRAVPPSFFGISTEYWGLPRYERRRREFERILAQVHSEGNGPMILRVGGDSADRTYWRPAKGAIPARAFRLTRAWLVGAAALVRSANLRVILDLNLVANSPQMAGRWVRAAAAQLPQGSIVGFEVGNEPDLYHRQLWFQTVRTTRLGRTRALRPPPFSIVTYAREFRKYARAVAGAGRGVPILGPAIANPSLDLGWVSGLLGRERRALGIVSAHRYPLSQCAERASPGFPTIARVLSDRASAGMARSVMPAIQLAHRAGLKFRLTELNSVTCGGRPGVSDTFATALWAPDALFELLRGGADGVNLHIRQDALNTPVVLRDGRLQARPLLYGLVLFTRTFGPRARLVRADVGPARRLDVKVWAVQVGQRSLRVLVIVKGPRSVKVMLHLPSHAVGTLQRLLAPSVNARSGVTLAGQWLDSAGRWQGRPLSAQVPSGPAGYRLVMPARSAALLTVPR